MTKITPTRVVADAHTDQVRYAVSPKRAAELGDLPVAQFVFVRDDGWSLAACGKYAIAAFETYRLNWSAVFEIDGPSGLVAEVMDPGGFEERLGHFLEHALIASEPRTVRLGDQVIERGGCDFCGWRPETDPANVPDELVAVLACQCRFCRKLDTLHEAETDAAIRARDARARGDTDEARYQEERRTRSLAQAGECLARCERGAKP
jgi:hypothetical protein